MRIAGRDLAENSPAQVAISSGGMEYYKVQRSTRLFIVELVYPEKPRLPARRTRP